MSHEDFDIERLADYLHVHPEKVERLAERGKLPGRRIGGHWRFSQAEIHHWWEDQIGASDDEELAAVESVLQRAGATESVPYRVVDMLPESAIAVPLEARTRRSVITAMVRLAAGTGLLWDEQKMAQAVRARENLHPTALGNGVALLHPRRPLASILAEPFLAFGRTVQGIPFGGGRTLTVIYFLICSREDRGHLRLLARLSRLVADADLLSALRAASGPRDVRPLLREFEQRLPE